MVTAAGGHIFVGLARRCSPANHYYLVRAAALQDWAGLIVYSIVLVTTEPPQSVNDDVHGCDQLQQS